MDTGIGHVITHYNVADIANVVDMDHALMQLAEEASELSQAALKLIRARHDDNPTPVTAEEAWDRLIEEHADVCLSLDVVKEHLPEDVQCRLLDTITYIKLDKSDRWLGRLRERKDHNNNKETKPE